MAKGDLGIQAPETVVYDQQKSEIINAAGVERKRCSWVHETGRASFLLPRPF
jgi:hypothetical protein